jgi:hypothetical protein
MMENEDSVVTSLNELRKLKHERITRQTQSRAVVGAGRAAALAVDPASDQMTPPPVSASSFAQAQHAPFQNAHAPQAKAGFAGAFSVSGPGYDMARMQPPPIIQTKTSVKAAVFVAVVLIGAGGAGYVKLQNDTQAMIAAKDAAIKRAEETRIQAAEMTAKGEVQSRNNLRQCEDKLKAAMAMAPAAPAAATPSAPAVEKKQEKPAAAKVAARAPSHKVAASRPARRAAQAEPDAPKSADVPNIAKKKKLDNDPLAGLNKL